MIHELLNNGSHGNHIALYKIVNNNNIFYSKKAYCESSNIIIEKEYDGFQWFHDFIINSENPVVIHKSKLYSVVIPYIGGRTFPPNPRIDLVKEDLIKIIYFYKTKWPFHADFALHGDISLNNIIMTTGSDDIMLIDWEHFHFNENIYYGIDIINMLFILVERELLKHHKLRHSTRKVISDCYHILSANLPLECVITSRPFFQAQMYLRKNYELYFPGVRHGRHKFTLASAPNDMISALDSYLVS